ncbi:CLUMA_CG005670, isoform A [Clunio marinus]|uniref:CLUMA_CG005670, isoform A n=1 Tax=Clunio marinus TaxID=568069 RepID=A0A1J1HZV2_9DIPT|nr:CLUMA_CG005670, isoform A [Clunio marinus]
MYRILFVLLNFSQFIYSDNKLTRPNLLEDPSCPQLKNLCSNLVSNSEDLLVLECIDTFQTSEYDLNIDSSCQHTIYTRKSELMKDNNIYELLEKSCSKDLNALRLQCSPEKSSTEFSGKYLSCVLDNRDVIKDPICKGQLARIETVAFSDFRLIPKFLQSCSQDIEKSGCGRLATRNSKSTQGETLACLQNNVADLSANCKKEIYHVSELQADNIKFDRQLYMSCSADVKKFCGDARGYEIYKCLMLNKNSPQMTKKCESQLNRRSSLIAQDYRISKGLAKACKEDIKLNHCRKGVSDDKDIRLAQILLCLEAANKNNTKILPDCLAEILDHRKMLMEDYKLSPEIIIDCADELDRFCHSIEGSKTIHCLMEHAKPRRKKDLRISAQCLRAVENLIKVSDVSEDWRVDPVLRNACKSVVDTACSADIGGNSRVMSCLMEKLGTIFMTQACETALLQIQYFTARDFKLDPMLYSQCKDDAIRFCHAKKTWADLDTEQMDPERGPFVLPCLHRYAYHPDANMQLSQNCFQEVKRVMRQRAVSVDLIPEVEDVCLDDLASFCFDKTQKGQEMECLQNHLEELTKNCKKAVTTYTEEESAHIELNPLIRSTCGEPLEKHCGNIYLGREDGDIMECLIALKGDVLKSYPKCKAAVEHFQLISLKNYIFTNKFKEACRPYVNRYCQNSSTKYDVVSCLSEIIAKDTIHDQKHSIPKLCREQVRSQLFQQRENIDLNPKLKNACNKDIKSFCKDVVPGSGQVLECLMSKQSVLSTDCKHALFTVKKSELTDSRTDFKLMSTCKGMLKQFCPDIVETDILNCLKLHKDEAMFDDQCHMVVVNRLITKSQDYRFNPELQHSCSKEIADYCTRDVAEAKEDEELNGKVINCLKKKFRQGKLAKKCEKQMTVILHDQALNYKLNPLLAIVCKSEIDQLCPFVDDEEGQVEECLKKQFVNKKIIAKQCKIEIATLIQEEKADIQADPILFNSCTADLLKFCSGVDGGNGRQLKCLQIILNDEAKSQALEIDCKEKLQQRIEMFKNAAAVAPPAESLSDLYESVVTSPSRKYFMMLMLSFIGFIFFVGLIFGRIIVPRRHIALKNK